MYKIENRFGLWLRWVAANSLGFTIGWGIHSPLAHGFTGDHDDALTVAQFAAHTIGVIAAGVVIGLFQRAAFRRLACVSKWSVLATCLLMPVMFWIGYYTAGIPYDLLLAFATVGAVGGVALRSHLPKGNLWLIANTFGFCAGLGITAMATYPIVEQLTGAFGGGLIGHTCLFLYIGAVGGTTSGAMTGPVLLIAATSEQPSLNGALQTSMQK